MSGDIQGDVAYRIRAELVCCNVYEEVQSEAARLERQGSADPFGNAIGRITLRGDWHDLCYWGEAAARIAEGQCPGYETSPNICACTCEGCKHNCSAHHEEEGMATDPRNMVGQNPTGRPTRSSGAKRARADRRARGQEAMESREPRQGQQGD